MNSKTNRVYGEGLPTFFTSQNRTLHGRLRDSFRIPLDYRHSLLGLLTSFVHKQHHIEFNLTFS